MKKILIPTMIFLLGVFYFNWNTHTHSKKKENLVLSTARPEQVGLDSRKLSQIDSIVDNALKNGITPGAVVLITKDGKIIKDSAYGYAEKYDKGKLLKNPRKMTVNTMFDLASITKVMDTTPSIMKLVEEGRISIYDPVVKYFPNFGKNGKSAITIEDLLTHTSGLPHWAPAYLSAGNSSEVLKYIENMKLDYKIGSKRVYSDFNFMLLGYIVEKVTHEPLDIFAEHQFYRPLGLKHTMFSPNKKEIKDIAATSWGNPYEYNEIMELGLDPDQFTKWRTYTFVGEVEDGNSYYANGGVAGHAGLFSTAKDLAVLGQMLLNGGKYGKTEIFQDKTIETFISENRFGQGLGWERDQPFMGTLHSEDAFGHNGSTGTQIIMDPTYNIQIIVLTNKQNNGLPKNGTYPSTTPLSANIADTVYHAIK